jgi:3-mercaptopyruvate sulfurtransferase SseA
MIDGGADIIIVDAQLKESYAEGHIKGAVNVPWDVKIKPPSGLSMTKLLIVYCGCSPDAKASDTDAGDVAMQLVTNYGYRKVAVLGGGWDRWVELKYPTEASK